MLLWGLFCTEKPSVRCPAENRTIHLKLYIWQAWGQLEIHNNSCHNRNCPNCQAVQKESRVTNARPKSLTRPISMWYSPHELSLLIYYSQKLLYGLLHRCCAEIPLELSADKKQLGAPSFHWKNKLYEKGWLPIRIQQYRLL